MKDYSMLADELRKLGLVGDKAMDDTKKLPHSISVTVDGTKFDPSHRDEIFLNPHCYFRADKMVVTDDSQVPGYGTKVLGVRVGMMDQDKYQTQLQCYSGNFSLNSIGRDKLDTCQPFLLIGVKVEWVVPCRCTVTLSGLAFKKENDTEEDLIVRALDGLQEQMSRDPKWKPEDLPRISSGIAELVERVGYFNNPKATCSKGQSR